MKFQGYISRMLLGSYDKEMNDKPKQFADSHQVLAPSEGAADLSSPDRVILRELRGSLQEDDLILAHLTR